MEKSTPVQKSFLTDIKMKKTKFARPQNSKQKFSLIDKMKKPKVARPQNSKETSKTSTSYFFPNHDHSNNGIIKFMQPELYKAVTIGDDTFFHKLSEDLEGFLVQQASPRGDSVLHIASYLGHDQLVGEILQRCPKLVESKNSMGNLPLHVAASAGKLSTVKILVSAGRQFQESRLSSGYYSDHSDAGDGLLRVKNGEDDNTALHLALKNRSEEVARFLVEADPEVTNYLNDDSDSPLFMAAEAGYLKLFELMMEKSVGSDLPNEDLKRRLVRVAISGKNKGVLELVLSKWEALITSNDCGPWNHPLAHAAFTGYLEGVEYILNKSRECSYVADSDGLYPIHKASIKGHIEIIEALLKHYPDSRELLNRENENILHVAAKCGKSRVVRYILNNPELQMLINERDREGNTPLHSACKTGRAKVVSILTWDSRVDLEILNNSRMTALDVAEFYTGDVPSFRQRLTWQALRYAGAPRSIERRNVDGNSNSKSLKPPESSSKDMDFYKDRVNTLLLVSILVATITFAAGFTSPTNMTSLLHKAMFHVFVISNTIAMFSSMTVVVALIWSQLGDVNLALVSLEVSVPLLGLSLTMVSVAFMTGVYSVVSENKALAIFVLVCGSIGILSLLLIFGPLYSPTSLNHRIPRYIFYYPLCLMIWVTKSDIED